MNKIIAMWSHPRSMSTAIERLMYARGDLVCLHEPFMYYHYLSKSDREMPYFHPDEDHAVTYEGVKQMILSKAKASSVFFKDMSYYVISEMAEDTDFNERLIHCFLIRHPLASIASYYALDNQLTLNEIGIEAQWQHYSHLTTLGIKPVVIQAESMRRHPEDYAARWWKLIDLPFDEDAFNWSDKYPAGWESVKSWHGSVIASSSIREWDSNEAAKQQRRFNQALETAPHLQEYLDHHLPYYERLKGVAF